MCDVWWAICRYGEGCVAAVQFRTLVLHRYVVFYSFQIWITLYLSPNIIRCIFLPWEKYITSLSVCNCFWRYGGFEPLKVMNTYICPIPYSNMCAEIHGVQYLIFGLQTQILVIQHFMQIAQCQGRMFVIFLFLCIQSKKYTFELRNS